jgi:hypothetical protein
MDELKNLRNYEEFKRDAVNEELLWDAVKKLFSTIFGKMDKKFADAINNFTKKLDGSKTWEEAVKFLEEIQGEFQKGFAESIAKAKGPLGVRKTLKDTYSSVYLACQEMAKSKYQQKAMSPINLFKGQPDEKVFAYEKIDDFNKNLFTAVNNKMIALNKDPNMGGPVYDEKALTEYLTKYNKDMNWDEINKIETAAGGSTGAQAGSTGAPAGSTGVPESKNHKFTNILNEYGPVSYVNKLNEGSTGAATGGSTGAPAGSTGAPAGSTGAPAGSTGAPAGSTGAPAGSTGAPAGSTGAADGPPQPLQGKSLDNFKEPLTKFANEQLMGFAVKKLKELKPPSKVGSEDAVANIVKDTKVTDKKDSMAKLVRSIVNFGPEKKPDLLKIRDIVSNKDDMPM